ncbi:MAG TPA: YigZ family protein [Bacteroidales bacterium]|nr:YigZ family protein [Bacteroidales bacterium]
MDNDQDTFLSIEAESQGLYREKASKFYAFAIPVTSEAEIKAALERFRKTHHGANHFCYAYRLGYEKSLYRMNDDGEPSGSAGRPIYGQLLSFDLSDVLIVVIRYFGGTKLGIPGLINAYKTAAREALEQAQIIEKTIMLPVTIRFNYPAMNDIMRIIRERGAKITGQGWENQCTVHLFIRKSQVPVLHEKINLLRDPAIDLQVGDPLSVNEPGKIEA